MYRRDVQRHSEEISRLQRDKSREAGKRADLQRRIASDSEAANRTSSASTRQSKQRDIERHQRDIASVEKRMADYEEKIGREQQRMADAQKKLSQEEDREFKKREREQENASRAQERRMRDISGKLQTHDTLHAHAFASCDGYPISQKRSQSSSLPPILSIKISFAWMKKHERSPRRFASQSIVIRCNSCLPGPSGRLTSFRS